MAINPERVLKQLQNYSSNRPFCLAYSGGVDSHVLLHLLATHQTQLASVRAVHIDHGLQDNSSQWALHCESVANALNIPFKSIRVEVNNHQQLGVEAAARQARYQALQAELSDDEVLLTGQHQQDQAETLMLQLLRGAGPAGLAAMELQTQLFGMTVIRPLLTETKADIIDYAKQHQLTWVEDPSNQSIEFNRNFLRRDIWPLLAQRWPSLNKTLSRSAAHCRESVELMRDLAIIDAEAVCDSANQLSRAALARLSVSRQRNVLRYVMTELGLGVPSSVILQQVIDELCLADEDRAPLVQWSEGQVRRYQDNIIIERLSESDETILDMRIELFSRTPVELPNRQLFRWEQIIGKGLKQHLIDNGLTIKFRQGGEQILLSGQHKALKKLFQQWNVPPWQRHNIPLLFSGDTLICVVGWVCADDCIVADTEAGWMPYIESAIES